MKYALLLLVLVPFASANVVISQVLYDPVGTESGGEAVELKNEGSTAVDISGWVLATENSAKDAVIPDNTILQSGASFLIADEGWDDSKDDDSWRSADYEEKITLVNSDGGVALIHNGSIVDAVGWGDEESIDDGLFEGSPAAHVASGKALFRVNDTDDNSADFTESDADFAEGIAVPVTADISLFVPSIEVSKSLTLNPEGVFVVKNNGESSVNVKLVFNDFQFKNFTIPKSAIVANSSLEFVVPADSEYRVSVRLRIDENVVPGKYTSVLRVITSYFGT